MNLNKNNSRLLAGRQAYSLMEMVVVFGIFGAVIGAVFVAANAVKRQSDINSATENLSVIVNNARAYYAGFNASNNQMYGGRTAANFSLVDANNLPDSTNVSRLAAYATKGIFPAGMVTNGTARTAWGTAYIDTFRPAGQPVQLAVRYNTIPLSACSAIVEKTSYAGRDVGMVSMRLMYTTTTDVEGVPTPATNTITYDGSSAALSLPITPADAASRCRAMDAGSTMTIEWNYVLANGCGAGAAGC